MTKLYAKWIFCIREICPEGDGSKCRMGDAPADFPADGKCLHPEFVEYDEMWEKFGAFEREAGTKIDKRFEKCEAACHALGDEMSKLQKRVRELEDERRSDESSNRTR